MGAMVLPDELTHRQAALCLPMLVQGIPAQTGDTVDVDAGSLTEFDSSVLAVLIELRRSCTAAGKKLRVHNVPGRLVELIRVYGLSELLLP